MEGDDANDGEGVIDAVGVGAAVTVGSTVGVGNCSTDLQHDARATHSDVNDGATPPARCLVLPTHVETHPTHPNHTSVYWAPCFWGCVNPPQNATLPLQGSGTIC